jgi:hypothetical protein
VARIGLFDVELFASSRAPMLAHRVHQRVGAEAIDPSLEGRAPLERVEALPDLRQRLLRRVVQVGQAERPPEACILGREDQRHARHAADEDLDRRRLAAANADQQVLVRVSRVARVQHAATVSSAADALTEEPTRDDGG